MYGEIRNPLSNPQSLRSFLSQGRKLYYTLMWTRTLTHRRKLKKRVPLYPCLSFPRHLCLVCSDACYPPSLCASALSQLWDSPWSGPSFCLFLNLCLSHISKVYLRSPLWVEISPPVVFSLAFIFQLECLLTSCLGYPTPMNRVRSLLFVLGDLFTNTFSPVRERFTVTVTIINSKKADFGMNWVVTVYICNVSFC